ncbi:MAG: hypothetical protein ABSF47_03900 [Minisyncoccia bacterium]|jgi:hypothetical protein
MNKKILSLAIFSITLLAPILSSAQSQNPANVSGINNLNLNDIQQNLPAPVSDFVNKLKGVFENGPGMSGPTNGPQINLSDVGGTWASINSWFSSKIGVSLTDIIKAVVNLIIWIWELIIKLIQTGLSYL